MSLCRPRPPGRLSGWAGGPPVGSREQLTRKQLGALLCTACYLQLFLEFEHVSKKFLNIFLKIRSIWKTGWRGQEWKQREWGAASPQERAMVASRPTVTVTMTRALDRRRHRPHPGQALEGRWSAMWAGATDSQGHGDEAGGAGLGGGGSNDAAVEAKYSTVSAAEPKIAKRPIL